MPTLYIGEYTDVGSTPRGSIPIPLEPPRGEQVFDLSADSRQSDAFSSDTAIVRLVSDVDCAIEIGTDPDATDSVRFLAAGQEKIVTVAPGSKLKVAAVARGNTTMSDSLGGLLAVVSNPAAVKKVLDDLVKQSAVSDKSAQALRAAADENRKTKSDADDATKKAEAAIAANNDRVADILAAAAAADAKDAKRVAQAESDKAEADKRKVALDNRDAGLITLGNVLDNKASVLAKTEADLVKRERDLAAATATLAAAQADYEERVAKLKALAG